MELFRIFGTLGLNGVDETNSDLDNTTDNAENSSNKMVDSFKKIGSAVATYFAVDKIIQFGKDIAQTSAEVDAETSAFSQIMGDYTQQAYDKMGKVADAVGMVDTRLTPYMTSMTAKFKGLGYGVEDATSYATRGLMLASDASAFWDKSLDDSMSALNSFINGSYEGGEAIGLFANDTQMASYAVKNGIVGETKEWANLDEARKQATRLQYAEAMMKASGAVGQASKESGQYANVQANLTEKWRQFKAEIGQPVLQNVLIPAMDKISGLIPTLSDGFQNLKKWITENKTLLLVLAGVFGALTAGMIAYNIQQGILALQAKLATTATLAEKLALLGVNTAMLASPITWIVAGIVALIAIIVLLVKNWDSVKEAVTNAWNKTKEILAPAIEWVKTKFTEAKEWIQGVFDSISEAFNTAIEWIKSIFNAVKEWFIQTIATPIANFYNKWIAPVVNKIIEIIAKLIEIVVALFTGLFNLAKGVFLKVAGWVKKNVIDPVVNFFIAFYNRFINGVTKIWNFIVSVFSKVATWVNTNIINPVVNAITAFANKVKSIFTSIWGEIKSIFTPVANFFKGVFQDAYNGVTSIFNKLATFFSGIWSKIKGAFSSLGSSIASAIGGAVKSGINGVISMIQNTINGAINLINGAINLINKLPGVRVGKISKLSLPRLAKGNVAYQPTVAEFGEYSGARKNPEITSPKSIMADTFRDVLDEYGSIKDGGDSSVVVAKLDELIDAIKTLRVYLDSGTLVGELAPAMDGALGNINRQKVRGQ